MPDLARLAAHWDALFNGPLLHDAQLGYIAVSVLRLLIGWAALLALRALGRYISTALPRPHTPANTLYWLRWWLWLRLRESPLLKIGLAVTAVVLILQIPTGEAGARNQLLLSTLLFSLGQFVLFAGLARFLNRQADRILCPSDTL